jgi:hypothetical protein
MNARVEHLIGQGLAKRQGQRVIFARDLLDTLRRRELEAKAAGITESSGLPYHPTGEGEQVAGIFQQRYDLASGRFAMINDELGFGLVPWSPALERNLGCHVSGIARGRSVDWSFGRGRVGQAC